MIGFCEWLQEKGYGNWVVAPRLTENHRRRGYDLAIPQKKFSELEAEYEKTSRREALYMAAEYERRFGASLLDALKEAA